MRPSILIATAVSGIVVALAVIALLRSQDTPVAGTEPAPTVTGYQPAFHLDATPDQRRIILESSFQKIASDRAERLGGIKDDIALLLDDPEAVRFIVGQWHQRRGEGRYADAAFADIFRLVKDPGFVEPTGELLASQEPGIRGKGLQAAETQASPKLGPKILAVYRSVAAETGDKKVPLKLAALRAAFASGGDALTAILFEAFRDENQEVAVQALSMATDLDVPGSDVEAKRLLGTSQDRRVRLYALGLLMKRGELSARDELIAALDPADPGLASEAAHIVSKYRVAEAAAKLRELRQKTNGELRRLFTLALLRVGDRDTWDEVIQTADTARAQDELDALQLLAASGDTKAVPILLHAIDRGGEKRVQAIAAGISTSMDAALRPVVEKLIEQPVGHPAALGEAPKVGGQAIVPRLAQLLAETTDPVVQVRYLSWLGLIGGKDARDVMVRERSRIRRLVDEQLRLVDLEARRVGKEAPPLSSR